MTIYIETLAYIQIAKSAHKFRKGRIVTHSSIPPRNPQPGAVTIRVRIQIPESAFRGFDAEAIITVPEELAELTPVDFEAIAPEQGQDR